MAHVDNPRAYTEAHHTVWADVEGADLVTVGTRRFRPERITVKFEWRTQIGDTGWSLRALELSGRWVGADGITPTGEGSGVVILAPSQAPEWARHFATDNAPTLALTERA